MTPNETARFEHILHEIDDAIGPPSSETEVEHEARLIWVARQSEARRIRKAGAP